MIRTAPLKPPLHDWVGKTSMVIPPAEAATALSVDAYSGSPPQAERTDSPVRRKVKRRLVSLVIAEVLLLKEESRQRHAVNAYESALMAYETRARPVCAC
jgi:hypothetical protein